LILELDRIKTRSRGSKPTSGSILIVEQTNQLELFRTKDLLRRHRGRNH